MACLQNSPAVEQRMASELRRPIGGNGRGVAGPGVAARIPRRRVLPPVPWYVHLASWLAYSVIGEPIYDRNGKRRHRHRLRRLAKWLLAAIVRVPMFVGTVFSRRVSLPTYIERQNLCWECPAVEVQLVRGGGPRPIDHHTHCGSCGCPRWRLSRLSYKNWRQGHECPQGTHPGSQPWRKLKETLEKYDEPANDVDDDPGADVPDTSTSSGAVEGTVARPLAEAGSGV